MNVTVTHEIVTVWGRKCLGCIEIATKLGFASAFDFLHILNTSCKNFRFDLISCDFDFEVRNFSRKAKLHYRTAKV